MRSLIKIFLREIRFVAADSSLYLILLGAPIVYAFMYGSIYLFKSEDHVKLALVDNDGTAISRTLTEQLNSSQMIELVPASNLNEAQMEMYRGNVQGYFYIQKGLEKNILSQKQANVNLALNASRFLPSSDLLSSVTKICMTVGAGVRKQFFNKMGAGNTEAMVLTNPINLDYRPLYNESVTYGSFLLPGLLAIILQQTLMIGIAASITSEKGKNGMRAIYLLSEKNISKMLLGKGALYFFVFMVFGVFFAAVNFSVLGVKVRGNYVSLFILFAIFISIIIEFGMLIGTFFKTKLFAFQCLVFTSYPIFLITGYSMPYQSFPKAIQFLSDLLPTSPFFKAYLSIVQAGGDLTDNVGPIIHLGILWLLYMILLFWRMNFLIKKTDFTYSNP